MIIFMYTHRCIENVTEQLISFIKPPNEREYEFSCNFRRRTSEKLLNFSDMCISWLIN